MCLSLIVLHVSVLKISIVFYCFVTMCTICCVVIDGHCVALISVGVALYDIVCVMPVWLLCMWWVCGPPFVSR